MRRLTYLSVLALMIIGMALSGCGDDDGTPDAGSTPTATPTIGL